MRKILVSAGLAVLDKPINYEEIALHEDSRDGEFLIHVGVWELLQKLPERGWSELETKLALTCGIAPNADGELVSWLTAPTVCLRRKPCAIQA